jgi:hypothetical protein
VSRKRKKQREEKRRTRKEKRERKRTSETNCEENMRPTAQFPAVCHAPVSVCSAGVQAGDLASALHYRCSTSAALWFILKKGIGGTKQAYSHWQSTLAVLGFEPLVKSRLSNTKYMYSFMKLYIFPLSQITWRFKKKSLSQIGWPISHLSKFRSFFENLIVRMERSTTN